MRNASVLLLGLVATNAAAITVNIQEGSPSFCTYATGSLNAVVSGGTPPYTFQWSNGGTDSYVETLVAGTYSVTVTDANSEQATDDHTLTPSPFWMQAGAFQGCLDGLSVPFRMMGLGGMNGWPAEPLTIQQPNYMVDLFGPGPFNEQVLMLQDLSGWPAYGSPGIVLDFTDGNGCPGTIDLDYPHEPFVYPVPQVLSVEGACSGGNNGTVVVHVPTAGNNWPQYVDLVWNGQPMGPLWNYYNYGEMFGETPHTVTRNNLPAGEYALVTWTRYPSQFEWVHDYFFPVDGYCGDSTFFTVPDLGFACGTVSGRVYMDDNVNCAMGGSEVRVPGEVLEIQPGGLYTMTGEDGYYQENLPLGSYTIDQQSAVLDEHCVGTPIPFDLLTDGSAETINVGDTTLLDRDVQIDLGSSFARPGFPFTHHIHISHLTPGATGTVTVTLTFDPVLIYTGATPTPSNVSGNTITWTLSQLNSFGFRELNASFDVPPNPGLIGTDLVGSVSVSIVQPEAILTNNSDTEVRTITGSYDPNAKEAVTSSGLSEMFYFLDEDEWIDYTIHFQNTGTDTAFTVVITDTLPPALDPLTFQAGARSHDCLIDMSGPGILRFMFPNILLPDSNVNEAASHGQVSFRIKPRPDLLPGTVISNVANIFFDFNPPVITEPSVLVAEFSTGVHGQAPVTPSGAEELRLQPNPAHDVLQILLPEGAERGFTLLTADGRVLHPPSTQRSSGIDVDVHGLAPGIYMVRTKSGTARFVKQ